MNKNKKARGYLVDVGVLLTKNDTDYEFYKCVYGKEFSFYDENQYMLKNLKKAKKEAKEYVEKGVVGTYAVVTEQDFFSDEITDCYYGKEAIVYSICKNSKGETIENFIK